MRRLKQVLIPVTQILQCRALKHKVLKVGKDLPCSFKVVRKPEPTVMSGWTVRARLYLDMRRLIFLQQAFRSVKQRWNYQKHPVTPQTTPSSRRCDFVPDENRGPGCGR